MGYIGAGISRFNTADELTVTGDATIDTTTLVVDSTNNRVGIGTASPTTALDVTGTVTADGLDVQGDGTISGGSRLTISNIADENNDGIRLDDSTTSRFNNLTQDSSGNFKIQHFTGSAWQNNLTVTTGGSVGIGTTTPDALLQIEKSDSGTTINKEPSSQSGPNIAIHNSNQTANNLSSIQFTNRGTNGVAETATAGIHVKHEAQGGTYSYGSMNFNVTNSAGSYATRMHISSDGEVGINTASPNEKLTIDSGAISFLGSLSTPSIGAGIFRPSNNTLAFVTGGSQRAMFDDSANFLVGATSLNDTNGFTVFPTGSGSSTMVRIDRNSNGSALQFRQGQSAIGTVTTTTSGVTYNTTSDIRLKQDIEPLAATDKLMAMNPVSYSWKADPDGPRSMGFIAQEMQEVMPEAVSTGDDDMMSMDYGRITPILVSALQDAHRKIDELAAEIAELKAS